MNCLDVLSRLAQILTGIAALFVSSLALFFTLRESRRKAEHDRLLVRPYLVGVSNRRLFDTPLKGRSYEFLLRNAGLGPARILSMRYSLDGIAQNVAEPNDVGRIIGKCLGEHAPEKVKNNYTQPNYLLGAKEEITVVAFDLPEHVDRLPLVLLQLRKIRLVVVYESLYGEKQEYDSQEMASPTDETRLW